MPAALVNSPAQPTSVAKPAALMSLANANIIHFKYSYNKMPSTRALKYQTVSSSEYGDIIKMRELEVNKEYFIKKINKSKFASICTTLNTEIDFKTKKLTSNELKDEDNNISFYANKPFNEFIKKNNVTQCCLRVTKLRQCKIDGNEYLVPEFEVAIIKQSEDEHVKL